MLFGLFRFDWTILIVLPALFLSIWAQFKVNSTYKQYSRYPTKRGLSGAAAARKILDANGLRHVRVEHIRGNLNDHFDPKARTCPQLKYTKSSYC